MNYEEISAFLTMQMKGLENGESGKEEGLVLLAMADYLLEQIQKEPQIFQKADLVSLRKVFLRIGNLSEKMKGFYEEHGAPLKEASGRIMERIGKNISALEEQNERIRQLEEEKIRDLEQAEEAEKIVIALEQESRIVKDRQKALEKQTIDLKKELERLRKENTYFEEEMERVSGGILEAKVVNQELQAYFSENEPLKKAILEEGYEDKEEFVKKLQEMKRLSEELMSSYDRILRKMLEDGERLQQKIKERQRNH